MSGKLFDPHLDLLERRFQALREQIGATPESCRPELEGALLELSQAIAALRADREAGGTQPIDPPGGREAHAGQAGEKPSPISPGAGPIPCEAMLRHIVNAIPDLLTVHDLDFNTILSNWHGHEFVPETDRLGQPKCYRVYHHRDHPCEDCHALEVLTTGQPVKVKKVNPVDGRVREVSAFPIRDESGRVVLVVEHVRDITERHLAEKALKASEGRFRTLIEDSPESLFLTDVQGTILAASLVAAQRLGKSLADLTGAISFDLFPPEVAAHRRPFFDQAVATGRPVRLEDARGDRHFDIHINPILDADGKVSRLSILALDITDRKKAEQALKESAATLRTLIEANPESLFLLDTRGMILAASRVAAQRLGKSLEEIIGTDLHGMLPPEVSKKRFEIMQGVVDTGQPARFEDVRGDFYFDSTITPIFDQDQVVQVAVLGVDITARKNAEQAMRDGEARFRSIFATAQDTIFIKDRSFRYTQVNPAMERLFGRPAAEIIGKTDLDLVGAGDTERIQKQDQQVLNGEVVKGVHTVPVQGVAIPFHYIKAPLQDDAGNIVGICGIARDITDLKQTEAALAESEERFRMLFEHAPDAYILADMQGEIIDCNQAAEELAGYGRGELIGNNFACLPWLDFRQQVRLADLLAQTARGEVMGPVDFTLTRKDGGEVIAEGLSLPLYIQGQNLVMTIIRDITARKQAEAALRESEALYRSLFENMLNGFAYHKMLFEQNWPQDYIFLDVNRSFETLTGLKDVVGKKVSEVIPGIRESDPGLFEIYGRVALTGLPERFETYVEAMQRWFSISVYSPEKEYFVTVFEDITAGKQAEEALAAHLEFLRLLLDTIPNPIFFKDSQGAYLGCNKAFEGFLGVTRQEIVGKSVYDLSPRELADEYHRMDLEVFHGTGTQVYESRVQAADGTRRHVVFHKATFPDPDGNLGGLVGIIMDITGLKQAEVALRESEAHYRALFDASPDAITVMDLEMNFIIGNRRGMEIWRQDGQDQSRFRKAMEYIVPEDQSRVMVAMQELMTSGQTQTFETTMIRADGTRFPSLNSAALIRDAAGNPQAIIGVARDISALKQAEAELRESEERFRAIFEYAPVGIGMADLTGRFIQANQALLALLGYSADEFRGVSFQEMTHPEDLPKCQLLMEGLLTDEHRYFDAEKRCFRKDGDIVWVRVTMALMRDIQGGPQYLITTVVDITARKLAEEALRESEQRFRLMAETIQDVFWIATPRIGKTVYVSPGFEYIWRRTREALYHKPKLFLETVHPEDRERVKFEIIAGRERSIPWDHEYRIIRPDGTVRWIHNRGFPVRDEHGRVILFTGVATDVTDHKALEGQLLQAQKMEAVGRLAGGVAHDFNNLLMAITGYGELMRAKVLKDDPLFGYLENILNAGDRAAALTQQLLTFSRQQIIQPQVIDFNRVVLDLEPLLRRLIGEDLHLEVVTDRRPAVVKADPGQMGQIIMNLVVNARDAMPQGGRLTLKTAVVDLTEGCASRFGPAPPGAYVMLVAQDTGVGMDEATQAHVFEPFFTTKEPGKGTGLGLSTVYGIVKQSGGYLDLESSSGAGSTFIIYLPRLESIVVTPKAKIPLTPSLQGEETILLVEDEDMLRGLLAKFLRLYGYTVLEARHGGEALLACERHPGPIHLMVTDVVMPQMSGRELADRLTPLHPEMKIIYMSGYTEDALVQHGVAELSVAFLQKPFRPIELVRRVHAVLHLPATL